MEKTSLRMRFKTSRLRTKFNLLWLKVMNPKKRLRCPECGRRPIIWGKPRWTCFCGCGHCTLHCRGRRMKDAIHDWNAREDLYQKGEEMPRVVVVRPYDGITINTEMECLLDENNELLVFNNEYAARMYLLEHGCGQDELATIRFDKYDDTYM